MTPKPQKSTLTVEELDDLRLRLDEAILRGANAVLVTPAELRSLIPDQPTNKMRFRLKGTGIDQIVELPSPTQATGKEVVPPAANRPTETYVAQPPQVFLPADLEDDAGSNNHAAWSARALRVLASQLGLGNDYYYPLLGAARLLEELPVATPPPDEWKCPHCGKASTSPVNEAPTSGGKCAGGREDHHDRNPTFCRECDLETLDAEPSGDVEELARRFDGAGYVLGNVKTQDISDAIRRLVSERDEAACGFSCDGLHLRGDRESIDAAMLWHHDSTTVVPVIRKENAHLKQQLSAMKGERDRLQNEIHLAEVQVRNCVNQYRAEIEAMRDGRDAQVRRANHLSGTLNAAEREVSAMREALEWIEKASSEQAIRATARAALQREEELK